MDQITFDTSCDDDRVEKGVLEDDVLRTQHEARPEFRIDGDEVHLHSAKLDIEIEGFGHNVRINQ